MLREIAPRVRRVAIVFSPDAGSYVASFVWSAEAAAPKLVMKPFAAEVHQASDLEAVTKALAREPAGGLILPPDTFKNSRAVDATSCKDVGDLIA
jgi:hypothetical protein